MQKITKQMRERVIIGADAGVDVGIIAASLKLKPAELGRLFQTELAEGNRKRAIREVTKACILVDAGNNGHVQALIKCHKLGARAARRKLNG